MINCCHNGSCTEDLFKIHRVSNLSASLVSATAAQELLAQRKGAQHFGDAAAQAAVQEADANNAVELYGLQRVFRSGRCADYRRFAQSCDIDSCERVVHALRECNSSGRGSSCLLMKVPSSV